jgi:hypothetical protein
VTLEIKTLFIKQQIMIVNPYSVSLFLSMDKLYIFLWHFKLKVLFFIFLLLLNCKSNNNVTLFHQASILR